MGVVVKVNVVHRRRGSAVIASSIAVGVGERGRIVVGVGSRDAEVGPEAEDEAAKVVEREAAHEIQQLVGPEAILFLDPSRQLADVGRRVHRLDQQPAVEHHFVQKKPPCFFSVS